MFLNDIQVLLFLKWKLLEKYVKVNGKKGYQMYLFYQSPEFVAEVQFNIYAYRTEQSVSPAKLPSPC